MDQQLHTPTSGENLAGRAVPAARPLSDFCMERVGDEVVLFDVEHNRYHTLNNVAFNVWQYCDGVRTADRIASEMVSILPDIRWETVSAAVAQLGESGLLQASEEDFESTFDRRRMMKLVAAGAIGTVGIPVVASITRLGPEASATHPGCLTPGTPCPDTGSSDCECSDCCSHTCNGLNGANRACI